MGKSDGLDTSEEITEPCRDVRTGHEEELELDTSLGRARGQAVPVARSAKLQPGLTQGHAGAGRLSTVA